MTSTTCPLQHRPGSSGAAGNTSTTWPGGGYHVHQHHSISHNTYQEIEVWHHGGTRESTTANNWEGSKGSDSSVYASWVYHWYHFCWSWIRTTSLIISKYQHMRLWWPCAWNWMIHPNSERQSEEHLSDATFHANPTHHADSSCQEHSFLVEFLSGNRWYIEHTFATLHYDWHTAWL